MAKNKNTANDFRLSHSSSNLLLDCETKYWHHKINKTEADSDYSDGDALAYGKAFHHVLEIHKHDPDDDIDITKEVEIAIHAHKGKDIWTPYIEAMVLNYLEMHRESDFEAVACEIELTEPTFVGYIDVILKSKTSKYWWIGDLKTAGQWSQDKLAFLHRDKQLNLYCRFAPRIASALSLDMRYFRGAKYRVTTKSRMKMKAKESYKEFVNRLRGSVKSLDISIPIGMMNPEYFWEQHLDNFERTKQLRAGEVPKRNYSRCFDYYSPCKFFSKCHKAKFTDSFDFVNFDNADTYKQLNKSIDLL